MNKPEALISLAAEITKAIELFTDQDSSAKQVLTQLASSDPASFFAAAIGVLAAAKLIKASGLFMGPNRLSTHEADFTAKL